MSENKNVCEFETLVNEKHLMDFKLYHNYHSVSGIATLLFGAIMLVICVVSFNQVNISYTLMTGFFGLFFTVYTPIGMYLKTNRQVKKAAAFQQPVKYTATDEKIILSQGDIAEELLWEEIYKIKATKKSLILYITAVRANVIPFECLGSSAESFLKLASKNLKPFQLKLSEDKVIKSCGAFSK